MGFSLPVYQDLSIEQDRINNLPLQGHHLVIGPPGTGKTVLAIYRCRMFERAGVQSTFIVYNRVLNWYLQQALREAAPKSTPMTFHQFLFQWYKNQFKEPPPLLRPVNGWREPDWGAIQHRVLMSAGSYRKVPHLVLDEAQDMVPGLFPLLGLIAENLTVFADDNQKMQDTNTTTREMMVGLGIKEPHELRRNYRNTLQIAAVAKEYYCGMSTGIPDLPDRAGDLPWLFRYPSVEAQARAILQYEKDYPDREIGVLVNRNSRQGLLRQHLEGKTVNPLQWYAHGKDGNGIDFDAPGIRILNYQSAKGLEFDTVFLPFLDEWRPEPASFDSAKMKMYVLSSRARTDLRMLYSDDELPMMVNKVRKIPRELYQHREVKDEVKDRGA